LESQLLFDHDHNGPYYFSRVRSFLNNNIKQENVLSQLKNVSNIQNKHIPTQKGNASNY